jgi:hypothetical protein
VRAILAAVLVAAVTVGVLTGITHGGSAPARAAIQPGVNHLGLDLLGRSTLVAHLPPPEAGDLLPGRDGLDRDLLGTAPVDRELAARMEGAARRQVAEVRRRARDRDELLLQSDNRRDRVEDFFDQRDLSPTRLWSSWRSMASKSLA